MIKGRLVKENIRILFLIILLMLTFNTTAKALEVTAAGLSASEIQAAANVVEAAGGGTVFLPAGEATHSTHMKVSDGVNFIGAGQDKTVLNGAVFNINTRFYGKLDKGFRISGMSLLGNSKLYLEQVHDFRIDHITIGPCTSGGQAISIKQSHTGLIDNVTMKIGASVYGILIAGSEWVSDITSILGQPTAIFIEDCDFEVTGPYAAHITIGHTGAHYVFRHNTTHGQIRSHDADAHGGGFGKSFGTRAMEIYNNVLEGSSARGQAIAIRGGGAVVFNNIIRDVRFGITMLLESKLSGPYPILGQPTEIWMWNNTFTGLESGHENGAFVTNWGNPLNENDYIKENRDFFLRAPSKSQDGFTYTPYKYPHPLRSGDPIGDTIPPAKPTKLRTIASSSDPG